MSATARCPRCGTELQNPGTPEELCPECLLKLGLSGAIAGPPPEPEKEPHSKAPNSKAGAPPDQPARRNRRPAPWNRIVVPVVVTVAVLLLVLVPGALRKSHERPNEIQLTVLTPETGDPFSLAVSPDGRQVVLAGVSEGRSQLWLRRMDSVDPQTLRGTEDAVYPFWSPDSRSIGFFAGGKLKRMDVTPGAGSPQAIANAPLGCGGTWNADRMILFASSCNGPLLRVSANGGDPETLVANGEEPGVRFPQFLPDGRHFLFFTSGVPYSGVSVGDLASGETKQLLRAETAAVYSSGYLLFARDGTLMAQPFDAERLEFDGDPFAVAAEVAVDTTNQIAAVSASDVGAIVYRSGPWGTPNRLAWFDRAGRVIEPLEDWDGAEWPALSPDGANIAVQRTVNGNTDIWLFEASSSQPRRLTFDPAEDAAPLWSPDGSRVLYRSNRNESAGFYQKLANGAGMEEPLKLALQNGVVTDWSKDGKFLLAENVNPGTGWDVSVLPIEGGNAHPVLNGRFDERGAQFSPDGQWIAYQSNESGRFEIYVQSFLEPGQRFQVTTSGGAYAAWRRDGQELFFISSEGMLMSVPILRNRDAPGLAFGMPTALFPTWGSSARRGVTRQYAVSDGRRFLISMPTEEASPPLTVILNWRPRP